MFNTLTFNPEKIDRYSYIRGLLKANNITHISIANELGVTNPCVSMILSGQKKSSRIQRHIAKRLDMPYADLWGEPDKAA